MSRPWCGGSRRQIPGHFAYHKPDAHANCPVCGLRLQLKVGCLPDHRLRPCLVAGCSAPRTAAGLCSEHNADIVGNEL